MVRDAAHEEPGQADPALTERIKKSQQGVRNIVIEAIVRNAEDYRTAYRMSPDHVMTAAVPDGLMAHLTYSDLDRLEKVHHIIAKTPKEWES